MSIVLTFLSALIFGLGLVVSGLINPAKVLNFLDLAGTWDPSLMITMGVAVITTAVGFRIVFGRDKPLYEDKFQIPTATAIDTRLMSGAAMFGVGWGLAGYCPGPAIAGLSLGTPSTWIFVAAMLAGMVIGRQLARS